MGQNNTQSNRPAPAFGETYKRQETGFDRFCDVLSTLFLIIAPFFLFLCSVIFLCLLYAARQEHLPHPEQEILMPPQQCCP